MAVPMSEAWTPGFRMGTVFKKLRDSGSWLRVPGSGFLAPGSWLRVPGSGFPAPGSWLQVPDSSYHPWIAPFLDLDPVRTRSKWA